MTTDLGPLRERIAALQQRHAAGELSEEAYASARAPLDRQLADLVLASATASPANASPADIAPIQRKPGRGLVALCAAFVVGVGALGYAWKGNLAALSPSTTQAVADPGEAQVTPEQIAEMVERLAQRLKDKPDDVEGWTMLGRSYMVLNRPAEARGAFERLVRLRPNEAAPLADLADAVAMVQNRSLAGEPARLLEQALKLDPNHLKTLALAGTEAFDRKDYAQAARLWERITTLEPPDSPMHQQARASADEARRLGGTSAGPPPAAPDTKPEAKTVAQAKASVSGTVSLRPDLRARTDPQDTVFIVARPADGSRMPLAVLRKQVKDLPVAFTLDDSLAMAAGAGISSVQRVVVVARISKSGQATPQPGDLEGSTAPVAVGSQGPAVEIANVR